MVRTVLGQALTAIENIKTEYDNKVSGVFVAVL